MSPKAIFTFSSNTESCTLPKQTQMPDVSVIVCVLTRSKFEGYVPAVVLNTSWNVYSLPSSSPDSFVEVFVRGEGIAASHCPLR